MQHHLAKAKMNIEIFIVFAVAMFFIANNGVANVGEVSAYLMFSTCFRFDFDDGVTGSGVSVDSEVHFCLTDSGVFC